MAKWCHDDMLDAALQVLKDNVDYAYLCSEQPTTYTEATVTYALADLALDLSGVTFGNGDVSGRKLVVPEQSDVEIDDNGTATHLALVKSGDTTLLYVTMLATNLPVTTGILITIPEWKIEIGDPV
jgi:hypothetical protein